jgi:hypothetical protein
MDQLRQPRELTQDEQRPRKQALEELRQKLRQQTADKDDPDRPMAQIVLTHLDKYWGHILPEHQLAEGERWQRTTNQREGDWHRGKRRRRRHPRLLGHRCRTGGDGVEVELESSDAGGG